MTKQKTQVTPMEFKIAELLFANLATKLLEVGASARGWTWQPYFAPERKRQAKDNLQHLTLCVVVAYLGR